MDTACQIRTRRVKIVRMLRFIAALRSMQIQTRATILAITNL